MTPQIHKSATHAWLNTLNDILGRGIMVKPRDMMTREILHNTFAFNMLRPVVAVPQRKLSYRFMAAEALWIMGGDDRVDSISLYNKNISQFSDNGITFFGAYGPKFIEQLPYVVNALVSDTNTRQAVMTFWRENPPPTKDVPCTVALTFNIRDKRLNCHVFMRSSDAWLGVPYDVFNFSMIALFVLSQYNERRLLDNTSAVRLGTLHLTAVSSHLYQKDWDAALSCVTFDSSTAMDMALPDLDYLDADFKEIEDVLVKTRDLVDVPPGTWVMRP